MKDEASQKPKRTIFPSLIWEGGKRGYKFSIYFVQDCGYIVRERGRISGRHFSPSLPQSESNFLARMLFLTGLDCSQSPIFPCDRRDRARLTINGGHLDFQLYRGGGRRGFLASSQTVPRPLSRLDTLPQVRDSVLIGFDRYLPAVKNASASSFALTVKSGIIAPSSIKHFTPFTRITRKVTFLCKMFVTALSLGDVNSVLYYLVVLLGPRGSWAKLFEARLTLALV